MALNRNYTITTNDNANISWEIHEDTVVSEFIEFALEIMGIDLTFSEFKKMSKSDRLAFIRDLKIEKVLDK